MENNTTPQQLQKYISDTIRQYVLLYPFKILCKSVRVNFMKIRNPTILHKYRYASRLLLNIQHKSRWRLNILYDLHNLKGMCNIENHMKKLKYFGNKALKMYSI